MTLTPHQSDVAIAYRNFEYRTGNYPTLQQVADELGVTKVTIWGTMKSLVAKGVMCQRTFATGYRGYELVPGIKLPDENRASKFPLVGSIN
jgi:biotin operon repressor